MSADIVSVVSRACGIPEASVRRITASAASRYKVFYIPKRNGTKLREVAQPAREVKAVQRVIVDFLTPFLPVHAAAMAYTAGRSIVTNASAHAGSNYLLKLDFKEFFPSIDAAALTRILQRMVPDTLTVSDVSFIIAACTWRGPHGTIKRSLCIGAPSSPLLSNAVMYEFDAAMYDFCQALGVAYTRYSDDLTFSTTTPDVLKVVKQHAARLCDASTFPLLVLNARKTVEKSRKDRFTVTGITLTNQGGISVGRHRKRGVRAGVSAFINGRLDSSDVTRLRGEIAFILSVEPSFAQVLYNTYGRDALPLLPRASILSIVSQR